MIDEEDMTGNVRSPESPGVTAGVKVADLFIPPAAILKLILSFSGRCFKSYRYTRKSFGHIPTIPVARPLRDLAFSGRSVQQK